MNEAKHTPGPWMNKSGHIFQSIPNKPPIEDGADHMNDMRRHTMIATTSYEAGILENNANARLIAAAPELLEKLVFCRRYIAELASIPGHKACVSATLPGIDAVIANAKGE